MLHALTQFIVDLLRNLSAPAAYALFAFIIFAESGLIVFFFLPGDSLLITAGIIASGGHLNVWTLIGAGIVAATLGNSVGYAFGRRVGPALYDRPDTRFFKKQYLKDAHAFFEERGALTIVLSRFTPVVRTFASIVAGIAKMDYHVFLIYNVLGGACWVASITLLGYFVGTRIPNIDSYIVPTVIVIAFVSLIPAIYHLRKK